MDTKNLPFPGRHVLCPRNGRQFKSEQLKVAKHVARNGIQASGLPHGAIHRAFHLVKLPLENHTSSTLRIVVDGLRGMFLDKRAGKLVAAREHIAEVLRLCEVPLAQLKLGETGAIFEQ